MKKFLSLFISVIMLFNLTAEIFAAPFQLVSEEQQRGITSTLSDAYNNNSSSAYNSGSLQNSYNNALNNLAEISNTYYDMQEMITNAISTETVETGNLEILNNAILKQEKDLAAYKERLTSYNKKVEAMGGMDNIEKQYALYQQWLDLKREIDQRKAELENIIKTGKDESAVKEAKQELNEYKKNYYSHENEFNKFKKDFDEISEDEEYLQGKENEFEFLTKLSEKTQQESMEAKEALLAAIPEDSGLTVDSDWDAIFEAAKKEMDKLEPAIEEAKSKVERIEAAQNSAYQKYLEDKFNNEFSQTLIDYCEYMSAEAEKYQRPAEYGKVNGHNVAIEPGSVVMRADGTLVADVKGSVVWEKQKSAYLACINSSWDERKLESMHSTLTMEELGDIKYGEYLLKYSFAEGKRLSDSETKQMGEKLARKNIGIFLVDPQSGLEYFYTLFGDLNQSRKLLEYFEGDWKNKGYGMTQSVWEPNEFGDMEDTGKYQLIATTDEGEAMKLIYVYKLLAYYNTKEILKQYFYALNSLMIQIMYYIARNSQNMDDIDDYLESIGISLSKDFLGVANTIIEQKLKDIEQKLKEINISYTGDFIDVDESLINQKLEEINRTYTEEEKEGIVQNTIQKRPFDPLIFALGPSHIVDRNRTLVRERRNAVQGFDLDNSQTIRDLLFFNTLLQTNYKVYKPNLEAWNNLAYHAYEEKAMILLATMLSLGQTMNDQYKVKPQNYYNELEEDLHEYGKDMVLDIGLSMFLGGVASVTNSVKTFVKSTVRIMTKNAIKVAFKSSFKQGIKAVGKRSLALTKMGAQKSIKNIGKALKGSFGSTDINALRKANSSMLNSSSKANVQAFRQLKFKSPLRGTSHTLGREQGTVVTNTISNIKSQYGIRASKTSKVFNADLTKQQVAKLSTDLDDFYRMQKSNSVATSKKGGFALSKKANSIPADVSKTQEAFKQNVKAAEKDMCGGHFRAAACTIVPMPQGVMDVLMGKANLKQLFNRNPYTNSLFNKSVNRTMKAIEKQGLDPAQADKFFVEEFSGRVNASPFMPKGRKQSLIKQVSSSMGVKPEEGNLLDNLVHAERHSSNPDKVIVYHEDNLGNVTAKEIPMKDFREATKDLSYDQKLAIKTRGNRLNNEVAQARLINKQRRVNEIDVELNNLSKSADGTNINRVRELQNEQKGLQLDIERGVIDLSNKGGGNIKSIKDKINSSAKLVKNTSEKTYTLGGDPNKVLVPVEDVPTKAPAPKTPVAQSGKQVQAATKPAQAQPAQPKPVTSAQEPTYTLGGDPNKVLVPVEDVPTKAPAPTTPVAQSGKQVQAATKPAQARPAQPKPVTPEQKQLGYKGQSSKSESPKDLVTTDGRFVSPDEVDLYLTDDISLPDFKGNFVRINEKTGKPLTRQDLVNENLTNGQKQLEYKGQEPKQLEYKAKETPVAKTTQTKPVAREQKQLEYKGQEPKQLEYKAKETPAAKPVQAKPTQTKPVQAKSAQTKSVVPEQKQLEYKGQEPKQLEYKGKETPVAKTTQTKPVTPEQKQLEYKGQETPAVKPVEKTPAQNVATASNKQPRNLLEGKTTNTTQPAPKAVKPEAPAAPKAMSAKAKYLQSKGLDARDIEEFKKMGLLDDGNYSLVKKLLDKGVDKMEIYNAAKTGKKNYLFSLYQDKIVLESRRTGLRSKGLNAEDVKYFEKVGLIDEINYPKVIELLDNGIDKIEIYNAAKTSKKGFLGSLDGLDALYNSKIVESSKVKGLKGLNSRDIEEFKKMGLLDDANYPKVKELLDKGVDKMEIYNAGKNGGLDALHNNAIIIEPRKKILMQRGFTENDIMNYENIGLLDDVNYPKVETLLNNNVDKVEIFHAYRNGTLDDLLKAPAPELSKSAKSLIDDGPDLIRQITKLENNIYDGGSSIWKDTKLFQYFDDLKKSFSTLQEMQITNAEAFEIEQQVISIRKQLEGVSYDLGKEIGVVEDMALSGYSNDIDFLILEQVKSLREKLFMTMNGL